MATVTCPNCGAPMDVKRNTAGKSYAVCKPCGAQFQPRSKAGAVAWEQKHGGATPAPHDTKGKADAKTPQPKAEPKRTPEPDPAPRGGGGLDDYLL